MKKILVFILFAMFLLVGCNAKERFPLTVTFIDVSAALSTDHTVSVKFAEEKDYEEYFIDILVKSDTDDLTLKIFKEFSLPEESVVLSLNKNSGYISLDEYKIFNLEEEKTDSMVGYVDALATTFVVNSNKDAKITFLAVIGEKEENDFKTKAVVSKEFVLDVKKHVEK